MNNGSEDSECGHKQIMINQKLSRLFEKFDSHNRIIYEFLIWFNEMERQNWNGKA